MARPYHLLVTRDTSDDEWILEFGDYSRRVVEDEREVVAEYLGPRNVQVITAHDDRNETAAAVVQALND